MAFFSLAKSRARVRLCSITIDQVETSGFRITGIGFEIPYHIPYGYDGIRVTNADMHDNGYAGMWMGGCQNSGEQNGYCFNNVYLGYSKIHDNHGIDIPEQTGNGVFFKDVDIGIIEHCVSYNNGDLNRNSGGGPVGIWAIFAKRITIQFNELYQNHTRNSDGDGFDLDGGVFDSVMQYNYAHDNDGAGFLVWSWHDVYPVANNIIRYNISENDSTGSATGSFYGGISLGVSSLGQILGMQIYGNTIYSDKGTAAPLTVRGTIDHIQAYNNIIMLGPNRQERTLLFANYCCGSGFTLQGNAYWGSGGSLAYNWGGTTYSGLSALRATGAETRSGSPVGIEADPQLTAPGTGGTLNDTSKLASLTAYKLHSGSPLIDRGLDLRILVGNPGTQDYYGDSLPQGSAFDVGAHEYPAANNPPHKDWSLIDLLGRSWAASLKTLLNISRFTPMVRPPKPWPALAVGPTPRSIRRSEKSKPTPEVCANSTKMPRGKHVSVAAP